MRRSRFGGGTGRPDGGVDASARAGDVHIGLALQTPVEFGFARTRPNRVCVGVHETRKNTAAIRIEYRVGRFEQMIVFVLISYEADSALVAAHHGPRENTEVGEIASPSCCGTNRRDDLMSSPDEEAHPLFSALSPARR